MKSQSISPDSTIGRRARIALTGVLAAAALVALPARTEAVTLTFDCVQQESGTSPSCSTFEGAYGVEIDAIGSDDVFFRVFHTNLPGSTDTGRIMNVYFDMPGPNPFSDSAGGFGVNNNNGAEMDQDSSPNGIGADHSGYSISGFSTTYEAEGDDDGIGEGQETIFTFDLNPGFTFANILAALQGPNPTLRIALFVESLDPDNRKEALFVNNPYSAPTNPTPVPEPASLILFGSGLAGIAGMARKRRAQRAAQQ